MSLLDFQPGWRLPFGEFRLGLDPLSVFFLATIAVLGLASGLYAAGYLRAYSGRRGPGAHYFFFFLLLLSMGIVTAARNAVLFMIAWELMTVSSFFLITFHDEKQSVRRAGYLYFVATHCGTLCLLWMFVLMSRQAGSMNFDLMAAVSFSPGSAGLIFLLALAGFGTKAGLIPLHIWLPHAHPAAPG
ncbi:MAG: oxidoreductase, partial [Candidatus Omnitrophica bacterium]|nr:oxidoreductase [Candidatus Omnitrophota bacterium]